jgi:hypothetical protein
MAAELGYYGGVAVDWGTVVCGGGLAGFCGVVVVL